MEITGTNFAQPVSRSQQSTLGLANDFETFLSLLTTQLENQDPLDPLDTNEFTDQLVQFSGVEQQIQTNQNLELLSAQLNAATTANMASFLGRGAVIDSNIADHLETGATWEYQLAGTADISTLRVMNADGETVFETPGALPEGRHVFHWDGRDVDGNVLPPGSYSLEVETTTADGANIGNEVFAAEIIREIDMSGGVPFFTVGSTRVTQDEILRLILTQ